MIRVRVRIPATSANLGAGFDCLGLALDLWNEADFSLQGNVRRVMVEGEGADCLPIDENSLIMRAFVLLYGRAGVALPKGVLVRCKNAIPLGSGLGSSASAVLLGLLGANALLGKPYADSELLHFATELEGHPDNAAAALAGGLTLAATLETGEIVVRRVEPAAWQTAIVLPYFDLSTHEARQALPSQVSLRDAVFNISRTALVIEALRDGDATLLAQVMDDRIHQPYRLPLIPGSSEACVAARSNGAVAAALSGAGPSVVAFFTPDAPKTTLQITASAMRNAFLAQGLESRAYLLSVSPYGAQVDGGSAV